MALTTKPITAGGGTPLWNVLPEGRVDAVLSAIVSLGRQETTFEGRTKVSEQIRLIFELPDNKATLESKDGTKQEITQLLSIDVTASSSEKSKLFKAVSALTRTTQTEESLLELVNTDGATADLLGKACVLVLNKYKTKKGDERNGIKDFEALHPKAPQPQAVRETFVFEITKPDLEIFKNKLSSWTRDKIMTCVNSDELPKELHKLYRTIKEEEAAKEASGGE